MRDEKPKIHAPPEDCGITGCGNKTQVVTAVVEKDGRLLAGAGTDFLHNMQPKSGVTFKYWVARCAGCYIGELYRARKGQRSAISGTEYVVTLERLREYWRENGLED